MIALGTLIAYTHRADVVRLTRGLGSSELEWVFQGKGGSSKRPTLHRHGDGYVVTFVAPKVRNEPAELAVEAAPSDNKSIMVWPEVGSGVVTGLVTKQIGKSVGGRGGSNMYGEGDWDPGYFVPRMNVSLYVVRWELKGAEFALVPVDCATPAVLPSDQPSSFTSP